jgi:hypothetical protein
MLGCLRIADLCRQQYASGDAQIAIDKMTSRAGEAIAEIYAAANAMEIDDEKR